MLHSFTLSIAGNIYLFILTTENETTIKNKPNTCLHAIYLFIYLSMVTIEVISKRYARRHPGTTNLKQPTHPDKNSFLLLCLSHFPLFQRSSKCWEN